MDEAKLNLGDNISQAMKDRDPNFNGLYPEKKLSQEPLKASASAGATENATSSCSRRMLVIKCRAFKSSRTKAVKRLIQKAVGLVIADRSDRREHGDDGAGGAGDPCCFCCGLHFKSDKALHGHMRTHPKRTWRGVRPPPSFTPASDGAASMPATAKRSGNKSPNSSSCANVNAAQSPEKVVKALLLLAGNGSSEEVEEYVEGKWHECPKCSRVFATGQSLGGHMRAHFHADAAEDGKLKEGGKLKFDFDLNAMPEDTMMEEALE